MYLRSLRVKGFKSFPRQTELLFEPGVAVVIGPNGSGKSNLVDAVAWVLGEQSPVSLRGASMQDVIFAGSDGRRASGSAEVELTFDNHDGALPLPTPEVSIARRVGRDGSSTYLINRSVVRLTDVVELMAGVGLGKELHSVVGQGQVESFLASKPAERRGQIEEAAGLGRYKRRRERAELKLREVRRNLEGLEVMEREVASQLTPLRRQATAAEQLRAVETEIAGVRGRLLAGELEAVDGELAAVRRRLEGIDEERAAHEAQLVELGRMRAAEEAAFARQIEARERHAKRQLRARMLAARLESCARFTEQRGRLLTELETAAAAERERLVMEVAGRPEEEPPEDWSVEEARLADAATAAQTECEGVTERVTAARRDLAAARAAADGALAERARLVAELASLERRTAALSTELERVSHQVAELETRDVKQGGELAAAAGAAAAAGKLCEEAASAETRAADDVRQTEQRLAAEGTRLQALAGERGALEAEIDHLRAALGELQDVGSDVLRIAEEYPGAVTLGSLLSCEPGYERALAAALSRVSGALAVPEGVDEWSLLAALKRAGVALARLIVPAARPADETAFPGASRLLDHVEVNGSDALLTALADVVLVDDLRGVPVTYRGLAVTRDGEYYRPSDGQLGIAAGVPTAMLLEHRARVVGLEARLASVRAEELAQVTLVEKTRAELEVARERHTDCAQRERTARIAAEAGERTLVGSRSGAQDLAESLERARHARETLAAEVADASSQAGEAATRAALLTTEIEAQTALVTAAEEALATLEAEHEQALAGAMRARVELEDRRAADRRAVADQERAVARAGEADARLRELDRRLAAVAPTRELCGALADAVAGLVARATTLAAALEDEDGERASPERGALRDLAEREATLRADGEALAERRVVEQVASARAEDRRRDLGAELDSIGGRLQQAASAPPADASEAAALEERRASLVRRRERIGPVNPLAEAQCAELGERAGLYRDQRRDLEKSLTELDHLIVDLTERIDREFAETFTAVQEKFADMAATLFPGGRGSLTLVPAEAEDEPGGVAVEVKPAKKLGKKLQQLSGGERALVAIAFLMALVLARPCPFYILDEIEAALDDVNIGRFVSLVREHRELTQFVIITHQKRTMEAADVLYGVTMGSDGGSRVVSARMAEQEIEREQSVARTAASAT